MDLHPPYWTQAFELTPGSPLTTPNDSTGRPWRYVHAFVCDTDGTVAVVPKEGPTTVVTIPVVAGKVVKLAIRQLVSASGAVVGFL